MKLGQVKHLFSCMKTSKFTSENPILLHKLVRLSVIAPQGDSALAQNSLPSLCQGTTKDSGRIFDETAALDRKQGANRELPSLPAFD